MKVAMINHWPRNTGVGGNFFELFQNMLKYDEIDVDMFYTNYVHLGKISNRAAKKIHFLSKTFYTRPIILHQFSKYFIHPVLIPKSYDLYHISDEMIAVFAKFNRPSVLTFHGPLSVEYNDRMPRLFKLYKAFLNRSSECMKYADKIVCISDRSKDDLIKQLPIVKDKAMVIYFGLDHELFKPRDKNQCRKRLDLPHNKKIVLNVGNEMRRKNIPNLLRALYVVKKKIGKVLLVRIGNQLTSTIKLIESLGLRDNVLHVERVPKNEMGFFYNAADLCILPSYNECLAFSSIEAMASGCPVASSDLATPEILRDAEILFDPFDIDDMAEKMERVLIDRSLSEELIEKGLKKSMFFSWERCVKETLEVYTEVLKRQL